MRYFRLGLWNYFFSITLYLNIIHEEHEVNYNNIGFHNFFLSPSSSFKCMSDDSKRIQWHSANKNPRTADLQYKT